MRANTTRNPVRVGFTPTFSITSSPPWASAAAPTRKAADEASPGTVSWNAGTTERASAGGGGSYTIAPARSCMPRPR